MNESISVINSIEIIPLEETEINPLLTRVRIKVFHLGENRNRSYIDKDTALSMAKTVRGNPIVARYREEKKDFTDHGQEIVINDKGISYKTLTKPYGFVDTNAKVWFEDFDDLDEQGQIVRHTYLVTEGYIWTALYEELNETIMDGGRPQSMELDEETLQGNWSKAINSNYEIFIINDAIITKLCALGEDVEPCFLGASIQPIFEQLTDEQGFVKELLDLKAKFNFALNLEQGGESMENEAIVSVEEETQVENLETEKVSIEEDKTEQEITSENENTVEEYAKGEETKEEETAIEEDEKKDDEEKEKVTKNSLEDVEKAYALLKEDYDELIKNYASLESQNKELLNFKEEIENQQKDNLIAQFYMLSDEDKEDVIKNKSKYTLEEIESKLSVICVRKKVSFEENKEEKDYDVYTYNLNQTEADDMPAWLRAVVNRK